MGPYSSCQVSFSSLDVGLVPSHIVTCYECSVVIPGDACCFLRGHGGRVELGGEETERGLEEVEGGENMIRM